MNHYLSEFRSEGSRLFNFSEQKDRESIIRRIGYEIRYPGYNAKITAQDIVIGFVISGQATIGSSKNKISVGSNDLFVRGLDFPCQFKVNGRVPLHLCLVSIESNFDQMPDLLKRHVKSTSDRNHLFKELLDHVLKVLMQNYSEETDLVNGYVHAIVELAEHCIRSHYGANSIGQKKLKRILNIMDQYVESEWELSELSDHCGISKAQITRLFAQHIGQGPSMYWRSLRLQRAEFLLRNSQLSVKEIAYRIGFRDPLYFSKVFKEKTGFTPRSYRSSI